MRAGSRGRDNVLARLPGDGSVGPLLLASHLDVVPAGPGWTHPPFAGEVHDGMVWGRGAIDMKHMAAMSATVLRLLAAQGVPLRRDVVLAAVADEEAGCHAGSAWLVDHHPEEVRAEYALGEVGGFTLEFGGRRVYPVQVAEKGVCWVRARARGPGGHGSMPRDDSAVARLTGFLDRVARTRLPLRPSPPVRRFLADLAATQDGAARRVLPLLARRGVSSVVLDRLVRDPATRRSLDAVLRNTVNPTVVRAGEAVNVIPAEATAELDGRVAVGSTPAELLRELRDLAGDGIELEVVHARAPTAADPDTPLFTTIAAVVAEHDPGAVAVPSVIPGFTDASQWSRLGTTCYGFAPVVLAPGAPAFSELFHAPDERIGVDGFQAGLRMLADVVYRTCVPAG